ncbi:MAG: hypothetical protein ACYSTF_05930 [Planctomycetota bacterium]
MKERDLLCSVLLKETAIRGYHCLLLVIGRRSEVGEARMGKVRLFDWLQLLEQYG